MKQPSQVSGSIEVQGGCARFHPVGRLTLEEAVELLDQTIACVRDRRIPKLLFNAKGLIGFRSPSLPERYFFSRQWATTSRGLVQVAMVVRAELIDPQKFGVTVARNSGMNADVFPEEAEALVWLSGEPEKAG
jgi:hypothetical protein